MIKKLLFLLCVHAISFGYSEYIDSFESQIKINQDNALDVEENITVVAKGQQIKRGIVREFPTRYKDLYGNNYNVRFDLKEILLDNRPVQYHQEQFLNGIKIYIGSENKFLAPGIYTYTIKYKTKKQLGFFDDYDELYWNVTGNGWRLPIKSASAVVKLPENARALQSLAFTGNIGQSEKDYKLIQKDSLLFFETTKPLLPGQGLTIAVSWPKGFVKQDSIFTKLFYFLSDNLGILLILICILFLLIFYLKKIIQVKKLNSNRVVIPLFEPPHGLLPSQIRYLMHMGYDNICIASEIVNMAVNQLLKIEYQKSFFNSFYILERNKDNSKELLSLHELILETIFAKKDKIELGKTNTSIYFTIEKTKLNLDNNFAKNFEFNSRYITTGWITTIACIIFVIFIIQQISPAVFFLAAIASVINILATYQIKHYTQDGQNLIDKINGFKMFLEATESERIKIIGTPPIKTPQLYEKYLPYAMALGVEKAWTNQFASVFEALKNQGIDYHPAWYISGSPFDPLIFGNFIARDLSSGLSTSTQPISSSTYAPGTSSGSKGGSSGGGSGGGGGGGW